LLESLAECLGSVLPSSFDTLLEKCRLREEKATKEREEAVVASAEAVERQELLQLQEMELMQASIQQQMEEEQSQLTEEQKQSGLQARLQELLRQINSNNNNNRRPLDYHGGHPSAKRAKTEPVVVDCDCGLPHLFIFDGEHRCRYYGSFECKKCHNKWTSAFTWKGEPQGCKQCNTDNMPHHKEQLQKVCSMHPSSFRLLASHTCLPLHMCLPSFPHTRAFPFHYFYVLHLRDCQQVKLMDSMTPQDVGCARRGGALVTKPTDNEAGGRKKKKEKKKEEEKK